MHRFRRCGPEAPWPPWLHWRQEPGAVLVDVLVRPQAHDSRIVGAIDRRLKVALMAGRLGSEVNRALVRLLSQLLRLPTAQVAVVGGHGGRRKTVCLLGVEPQRVLLGLAPRSYL